VVESGRTSIRYACQMFALSETGYRYQSSTKRIKNTWRRGEISTAARDWLGYSRD
jgi:putative transposase